MTVRLIEELRSRRVRHVSGKFAGEPVANEVFHPQNVGDPGELGVAVVSQPKKLRGREARRGQHARQLADVVDIVLQRTCFGCSPAVVPEDSWADWPAVRVKDNQTVHLTGKTDRFHCSESIRRMRAQPIDD